MRPEQLQILQHSLGVNQYGQGQMYRNHFVAGGSDLLLCRELVALGYMKEHQASEISGGDPVFTVTELGKLFVRNESPKPPKLTRSQQRYRRYIEYGECFKNFREFLNWDAWQQKKNRAGAS